MVGKSPSGLLTILDSWVLRKDVSRSCGGRWQGYADGVAVPPPSEDWIGAQICPLMKLSSEWIQRALSFITVQIGFSQYTLFLLEQE